MPRSTTAPSSTTAISSAARTVESRWAMTIAVRPVERLDQRRLHGDLGLGVQVRGGLVEDHHPRPGEQQPGDREALALAAREPVAALAHHRVQAVGQRGEQLAEPGAAQGVDQLGVGGVRGGVAQVGRDRVVEQVPVLGDDADRAAQRRRTSGRARRRPHSSTAPPSTS